MRRSTGPAPGTRVTAGWQLADHTGETDGSTRKKWLGKVITVRGPIPADELGVTLPHRHILIRHQGPLVDT